MAAEGGGDDTISNNTIYNASMGIVLSSTCFGNSTICQNTIYNWGTFGWTVPAIQINTDNNIIIQNLLLYAGIYPNEEGVSIEQGNNNILSTNQLACGTNSYAVIIVNLATNTTISSNTITAVYPINDEGTNTLIFNNQVITP